MHGGGVGRVGRHDDGVLHRAVLLKRGHKLRHLGRLLADGDVDADKIAAALVDDRIDGDGRLAGGAVTDDQLALAATDGNHGVHRLDAGLHRLVDGLAGHDVRRDPLQRP